MANMEIATAIFIIFVLDYKFTNNPKIIRQISFSPAVAFEKCL